MIAQPLNAPLPSRIRVAGIAVGNPVQREAMRLAVAIFVAGAMLGAFATYALVSG